jgi:nitric oxide reductase subunit C
LTKRQARLFALGSTTIATLAFVALTIDSHRQFPKLTNAQNITPAVTHGKDVWHRNNCINCHTLFGEGAYYAPDLTKIAQQRGAQYLQAYLRDPSKFYDEQRHRRLMPKQDMTDAEIADLVAFLDWVSKVDNQGWPPRPILVTGASIANSALTFTGKFFQRRARAPSASDSAMIASVRRVASGTRKEASSRLEASHTAGDSASPAGCSTPTLGILP